MKLYSVLTLLFITCSIHALPFDIEFDVRDIASPDDFIDTRENIEFETRDTDVSSNELREEIGADIQTRDLIIHNEARGDVGRAGRIMGTVSTALTPVSAAGPVGVAVTVVKAAVKILAEVLKAIGKAQHSDALKRGAFTQEVVDKTLKQHPGWNCVVASTKHKTNFKGQKDKDWAHEKQKLKLKFPVGKKITFDIYTFREGTFELLGDGGFLNWAFGGQFKRDGKKVTFTASNAAKGSAKDAVAGTGKEAAKDSGRIAKQQEENEKKGKKSKGKKQGKKPKGKKGKK